VGRAALRQILGRAAGTEPSRLEFAARDCALCGGPHGKPVIAGSPSLHFSSSRSGGLAVVAVAAREVGVDVECRGRGLRADALARELLGDEGRALIRRLPADQRPGAVLDRWTEMEALAKRSGHGLCSGLEAPANRPAGVAVIDLSDRLPNASGALAVEAGSHRLRWRR
jgi:4'-phosphopantetheinyl transferase